MDQTITIRKASLEDVGTIQQLAYEIWPVTYGHLMSADRLQYMLQLIYSPDALQNQMQESEHIFLLAEMGSMPVGFASYAATPEAGVYKLHKIYVSTVIQGKGIGKMLLQEVLESVKKLHATALILNVKRDNPAKFFYEKLGFVITREEDIDIGQGYFMNDYVMEKKL